MKKTIYKNKEGLELTCKICGKNCKHLGSHIWHKHKIRAKEYKATFELPYKMSLISVEVYNKKSERFEEHRDKFLNNLLKFGKKYHFKKGTDGHRRMSEYEKKKVINRILEVNKGRKNYKQCEVCKMKFKHLESHLYNAHKLLKVK